MGIRKLPVFEGYTLDIRLKEFRRIEPDEMPEFIPFDSEKGDELLVRLIRQLDTNKPEDSKLLDEMCRCF